MRHMTAHVRVTAVGGLMALSAMGCEKDPHVRHWIRDTLRVYLDSLTREACTARERDGLGENWLCKDGDPDTYQKPPTNGKP
jgi:hypothetical protein